MLLPAFYLPTSPRAIIVAAKPARMHRQANDEQPPAIANARQSDNFYIAFGIRMTEMTECRLTVSRCPYCDCAQNGAAGQRGPGPPAARRAAAKPEEMIGIAQGPRFGARVADDRD